MRPKKFFPTPVAPGITLYSEPTGGGGGKFAAVEDADGSVVSMPGGGCRFVASYGPNSVNTWLKKVLLKKFLKKIFYLTVSVFISIDFKNTSAFVKS